MIITIIVFLVIVWGFIGAAVFGEYMMFRRLGDSWKQYSRRQRLCIAFLHGPFVFIWSIGCIVIDFIGDIGFWKLCKKYFDLLK